MNTKIREAEWLSLRAAISHDDRELFERLVSNYAHRVLAEERVHQRTCGHVRSLERGERPYLCIDR